MTLLERCRHERARSVALLGFDPSEPRDESGKWTDSGGSELPDKLPTKYTGSEADPKLVAAGLVVDNPFPQSNKVRISDSNDLYKAGVFNGSFENKNVLIDSLKSIQDFLVPSQVDKYRLPKDKQPWGLSTGPIAVVKVGSETVILDGTHRWAAAILEGDKTIDVNDYGEWKKTDGSWSKVSSSEKKKVEKLEDITKDISVPGVKSDSKLAQELVDTWNEHVDETPAEFKRDFLGDLHGSMSIEPIGTNEWLISGVIEDEGGTRELGSYRRQINFDSKRANNSFFELNDKETGHGVGKRMLAANVALYQKLGFHSMDTHASGDVGGYAWARYGYVPTKESWHELSRDIGKKINEVAGSADLRKILKSSDPKAIWAIADSKYGKDLLLSTSWDGTIDFDDDETMKRFDAYVGKKR